MLDLSAGKHLILDLYGCKSELLFDRITLLRFLDELPGRISMSVLMPAIVKQIKYPKCAIEDEGLSGVVVVCESHIAIHSFVKRGYVMVDVASCKDFDEKAIIELLKASFASKREDVQILKRGRLSGEQQA